MERNTYLFLHIPEQVVTGIDGLGKLDAELHLVATVDTKFDGLLREIALEFNTQEQKQTAHAARKLIVAMASNEKYAKEIAATKI